MCIPNPGFMGIYCHMLVTCYIYVPSLFTFLLGNKFFILGNLFYQPNLLSFRVSVLKVTLASRRACTPWWGLQQSLVVSPE
jgi:hypothetical protein